MMSAMREAMELADFILIISLINLFMMINNSTEGPWLLLQFHKQKSFVQIEEEERLQQAAAAEEYME
jgi:hypothetical protein